jgi:hypothetical protein
VAVEAADTAKAGRGRDRRHRQARLVEQLFGEVRAPRQRDAKRGCADMFEKEPAQVPRGHAQTR